MYAMMDQARTRASAKATAAPLGMIYMLYYNAKFWDALQAVHKPSRGGHDAQGRVLAGVPGHADDDVRRVSDGL